MSEIEEYRGRIAAALERIGGAADRLIAEAASRPAEPDGPSREELTRALEEERVANAQLEERVRSLRGRQEARIAELEAEVAAERDRAVRLDGELHDLRQSSADLIDIAEQLREALTEDLADPSLVDRAVLAELEAVKAERDADRAEMAEIAAALRPIVEEAS